MTPYHYGANNPIKFIDVNGDSLILHGDPVAIDRFLRTTNNGLGGLYEASIDESGLVTLCQIDKEGKLTSGQSAFLAVLSDAIDLGKSALTLGVVQNSEDVLVGSFDREEVDIADIEKFGDGPIINSQAIIGHELTEQIAKQRNGNEDYDELHRGPAMDTEKAISGSYRVDRNTVAAPSSTYTFENERINGVLDIRYHRDGQIHYTRWTIWNNNVESIQQ